MRTTMLALVIFTATGPACAQSPSLMESYEGGRAAVERAAEYFGGREVVMGDGYLTYEYESNSPSRLQGRSYTAAYVDRDVDGSFTFDLGGTRQLLEVRANNLGGRELWFRRGFVGDTAWNYRVTDGELTHVSPQGMGILKGSPGLNAFHSQPVTLLRQALSNPGSIRLMSSSGDGDRVSFTFDGATKELVIDDEGRITALHTIGSDVLAGDAVNSIFFDDYRPVGPTMTAYHRVLTTAGDTTTDARVTRAEFSESVDATIFQPPTGVEFTAYPQPFQPLQLATGVWQIPVFDGLGISYNTFLVVQDDGVVIVEAPLVDLLAQFVPGIAANVSGGKQVKGVVSTHYHSDHSGGVRGYLARGIDVYTTRDNAGFLDSISSVRQTLGGNPTFRQDITESLTMVDDSLTIGEGDNRIVVYQIGPSPHVDEILIAYLPGRQLVIQSDLATFAANGEPLPPTPAVRHFVRTVQDLGLTVERVAGGHGTVGTWEQLLQTVE